jgi:hypothetical protein
VASPVSFLASPVSFVDDQAMEAIAACFERTSIPSYKLLHAVNTGDTASVSTLLSTPDAQSFINIPNESGCTPLHLAVVKGNAAVTKDLKGCTPLCISALQGQESVTKKLLLSRCNVDLQIRMAILRCRLLSAMNTPKSPS